MINSNDLPYQGKKSIRVSRSNASQNYDKHGRFRFRVMFCGSIKEYKTPDVIGVDFDGTLFTTFEPYDPRKIGKPVPKMIKFVQKLIKQGKKVVILTARMNTSEHTPQQLAFTRKLIRGACKKYIGKALPVTAEKHSTMKIIYDDRAVQVVRNTGKIVQHSTALYMSAGEPTWPDIIDEHEG